MTLTSKEVSFLEKLNPKVYECIRQGEPDFLERIKVFPSKSGALTMQMEMEGKHVNVHSLYDPLKEADSIIGKYTDIEKYGHVFFYGCGLGYHIEAFKNKYPDKKFSIYEAYLPFFYHLLKNRGTKLFLDGKLFNHYIETKPEDIQQSIIHFLKDMKDEVLLVIHPFYEQLFHEKSDRFLKEFQVAVKRYRNNVGANVAYEKLWTVNSMRNFPKVINTPNIFDCKEVFHNKPCVIASAGPSLHEELNNLKHIKRNNSAYIFAVGSANKVLLQHGIIPDAVCSYDPIQYNHVVFKEIIEEGRMDIPLIYGSPVGWETLRKYPGPMFHMITGQDTVAGYFLQGDDPFKSDRFVRDAPSIAVVTLELLAKLGASPIILVGQNLALRNEQYYSQGISYESRPTHITRDETNKAVAVRSVDGGTVLSLQEFIMMRAQMEMVISENPHIRVVNTTVGGAHIDGTSFERLSFIMGNELSANVTRQAWYQEYQNKRSYSLKSVDLHLRRMDKEVDAYHMLIDEFSNLFRRLDRSIANRNPSAALAIFPKFDSCFNKLLHNLYYRTFLKPMGRNQYNILFKVVPDITACKEPLAKAKLILEHFGKYIYSCQQSNGICANFMPIMKEELGDIRNQEYEHGSVTGDGDRAD